MGGSPAMPDTGHSSEFDDFVREFREPASTSQVGSFTQTRTLRTLLAMIEADARTHFPPVLTAALAAELLQVHVEYLRRMVREQRVPCHRFPGGRGLRFLRDELLSWLAELPGADQSTSTRREVDAVLPG
jgi:excisionase family DNA binding protein